MNLDIIIKFIFIFSSCGLISVGYFTDPRLILNQFYGIDLSLIITSLYIISASLLLLKIRTLRFSRLKFSLIIFYLLTLIASPLLWMNYGVNDYGINKYLVFSLIIFPTSLVILETFTRKDSEIMMWVFFSVSIFLMILGILNIDNAEELKGGRMSVMGGGPIVYARWMVIGVLILFFHPNVRLIYKIIIITLLLFMAFTAGSRGPLYSFLLVMIFYFIITFRKNSIKFIYLLFFIFLCVLTIRFFDTLGYKTIDLQNRDHEYGNTSRVFIGTSSGAYARIDRIKRSISLVSRAPLGVGIGNWARESNDLNQINNSALQEHRDKEYPHNIILEITNESGLLIALVFLILLLSTFISAFQFFDLHQRWMAKVFFILFFYMLINSMISGDLIDSRFLFVFLSLYISRTMANEGKILEKGTS